ncbi:MAG: hypothetical protein B6242_14415 [Anaerolineaceae bacterium 4572_78]|nr:MAG: hypothetical protein B6242_14415 [Anaerolineaceae bacterium 4572_78]
MGQKAIIYDADSVPLSLEFVMDETKATLKYFTDNADIIMGGLKPGWDSGLLEVMDRLEKQIDTIKSEADFVDLLPSKQLENWIDD